MKKLNFLLASIKDKAYYRHSWVLGAFSITRESEASLADRYPYKIIREDFGVYFIDHSDQKVQIEDAPKGLEPLFTKEEKITITREWISSLKEDSLVTSVGILLTNLFTVHYAFGDRFPYRSKKFGSMEQDIIDKLESNPPPNVARDPSRYYVDEYLKFKEGCNKFMDFAGIFAHSITRIGLTPPPGRAAFKAALIKEYEGQLEDPVKMVEFRKKLSEFDEQFLKNDPSFGKFMSGKVRNAREKAYLSYGGEINEFDTAMKVVPITVSLDEGIPKDPAQFLAMANNSRHSSFARGAETVNGGVVAKRVGQASDSWRIVPGDCGTKLCLEDTYNEDDINYLVGCYIVKGGKASPVPEVEGCVRIEGGEIVLVETKEMAKEYINRKILVRSPQFCRSEAESTCEICASKALSIHPNGLSIPTTEMSGGILTDSLKKMHQADSATAEAKLDQIIT